MSAPKLWLVNGITRKGFELGGVGMTVVAVTEAEAIGAAHLEVRRQSPDREVAQLWANDISAHARQFCGIAP